MPRKSKGKAAAGVNPGKEVKRYEMASDSDKEAALKTLNAQLKKMKKKDRGYDRLLKMKEKLEGA